MAEMETLAEHLGCMFPNDAPPCNCDAAEAAKTALSWLASVLADDATVEVVARAIHDSLWLDEDWSEIERAAHMQAALAALAALSAHLTAPTRAGDTSGEEGL